MSSLIYLSLLFVSAAASPLSTPFHDVPRQRSAFTLAPLHTASLEYQHPSLNDSYIIMLKHDLDPSLMDNHFNFLQSVHEESMFAGDDNSGVRQVYDSHIKGYAGRFTEGTIYKLREMPEVQYIEQDQIMWASELDVQKGAPWVCFRVYSTAVVTNSAYRVLLVSATDPS